MFFPLIVMFLISALYFLTKLKIAQENIVLQRKKLLERYQDTGCMMNVFRVQKVLDSFRLKGMCAYYMSKLQNNGHKNFKEM